MSKKPLLVRVKGESEWKSPSTVSYSNEAALQQLLRESPQLLPGSDGTPCLAFDEVPIPEIGYLDIAVIDLRGQICLVECKLARNPEIRRSVVGQIFAYAAGLWRLSYDELDGACKLRTGQSMAQIASRTSASSGWTWDEEQFRAAVAANLSSGR